MQMSAHVLQTLSLPELILLIILTLMMIMAINPEALGVDPKLLRLQGS